MKNKRTLENLFGEMALLDILLESMPDGVLIVDEKRQIVRYNTRFLNLWNLSPKHI
jgi:PAS domain-containing protein